MRDDDLATLLTALMVAVLRLVDLAASGGLDGGRPVSDARPRSAEEIEAEARELAERIARRAG